MEPTSQSQPALRILLVDDDEDDYVLIRRVLASEEAVVQVDWAASYAEGREAVRAHAHDVILVDYRLGDDDGRDGLDIVREARQEQAGTPCVLFTGAPRVGLEVASLTAGAAGFLTKSELSPSRLMHAILQALEHGKTESELLRTNRALSLILRATKAANEAPSERRAFEACLRDVCTELGWDAGEALLVSERKQVSLLVVQANQDAGRARLVEVRARQLPSASAGLLVQLLESRKPVFCVDLAASGDAAYRELAGAGFSCAFLVPVLVHGEVVAVLELYSASPHEPDAAETDILTAVATQLAQTLARSRAEAERKRVELELHLAQRMEALGRLAGGIAHDFNNLLSVVTASAELLLMLPPEERADETIETMRDAAQRGGRLTRQLLALGQRNVAAPRIVDVNALIRSNESLLTRSLRENIALRLELSPQAGCIEIDPNEFEQSLLNLVLNARDAIAGHGTLSIATGVQMRATGAEAKAEQPYVLVEIHDTGIGMSPDTIEHIFEPFFTTKETGKGTGLGLSCVYSIVRQAGGAIEVESEPGVGTWFRLYFPQRASAVAHALSSDDETSVVGGTETVLVVEDDAAVRSTAALVLESYGYRVLCAADPQEALTVARRIQDIDLVLSDVVMPQMSGVELAGELAKLRPGTPVLFMSGYAQAAIEEEGLLDVARRLVQKPFTAHELALQVRKALDDALHMPTAGVDAGHH